MSSCDAPCYSVRNETADRLGISVCRESTELHRFELLGRGAAVRLEWPLARPHDWSVRAACDEPGRHFLSRWHRLSGGLEVRARRRIGRGGHSFDLDLGSGHRELHLQNLTASAVRFAIAGPGGARFELGLAAQQELRLDLSSRLELLLRVDGISLPRQIVTPDRAHLRVLRRRDGRLHTEAATTFPTL